MVVFKSYRLGLCLLLSLSVCVASLSAADWPGYRHDNARTGSTSESLNVGKTGLVIRWVYSSVYPPHPAWSGPAERPREGVQMLHRVIFDDAFQVAAVGDMVYFGSSVDDKVYALDSATGAERWSFFTGAPVRLAPTVWKNRVFVGSDDGYAYCLDASDGRVLWKVRAGPNGEKLLGNGRMISRWPVRTGVLVEDGTAYFGAGIFPHETVYLCAVGAEDGKLIWKNDTISEDEANRNDFSPQGYLLAAGSQLFVPSGRSLPVAFNRATGRMNFDRKHGWRSMQTGGVVGGTYALLADEQIYTGTQRHLLALDQKAGGTGFGWFPGRRLAVVGDMAYLATGSELVAMDRSPYAKASGRRNSLEFKIKGLRSDVGRARGQEREKKAQQLQAAEKELQQHRRQNIEPAIEWRVPSWNDAELILCGNIVFAGGDGRVEAFDRDSGKAVWDAKVVGKARGLAVANGRLYVSTDKGKIYCFAAGDAAKGKAPAAKPLAHPVANPYPQDELSKVYEAAAEALIMETGVNKGYCLVVGAERGRLAYELARRTDLMIIGVEPDPEKVRAARQALDAANLYGERITIDQGRLSPLPYSNYFANLIVSDSLLLTGKIPGDAGRLVRHLKPCGGVICLGVPANASRQALALSSTQLSNWLEGMELGRCRISETNGRWAALKRGALPGAGKWTHQYAEPGNTACSDEMAVSGPLGLLWFGEPGSAPMVNRHDAAAAPLAINGKLFIQGENVVMAYDSYNGTQLWERKIPGAMRTRLKKTECGNLAASEDSFFVATGQRCLRLDAETGQTRASYPLPVKDKTNGPKWGYLAYVDGVLYGSAMTQQGVSNSIFAIDTLSGDVLWSYDGKNIVNLTIAVGDGWLFFIDSSLTAEQREKLLQQDKSHLKNLSAKEAKKAEARMKKLDARLAVALDARTGGKVWEKPVDVTDCSGIGIGGGELSLMYSDGVAVLCGANANGHYWRQFLSGQFSQRRLVVLSAKTGDKLWARDANYRHRPVIVGDTVIAEPWGFDLKTGEPKKRRHPLTGELTTWQFFRPGHHCGAISACPQMLFMRSGFTSYYDLNDDSGIRHFAGHRLGCWVNAIPANGLALMPEASAGCLCLFPIICSVVLEPRSDHERWGIYSAGKAGKPIRRLAVNLGAPGDRRDADGVLWLSYPRPGLPSDRAVMGFSFDFKAEFFEGGGYFRRSSETEAVAGADKSWLFASCGRGLKRCVLPLLGEQDKAAEYTVRLYFAELEGSKPGERVFDIKLQGKKAGDVDVAAEAAGSRKTLVDEYRGIQVNGNLEIELVPRAKGVSSMNQAPVLCGVEVIEAR